MNYFLMPHPPVIIPEIGQGEERKVINTVKACIQIGEKINAVNPDTIIIISPHGVVFKDAVAMITSKELKGDFGKFGAPQVEFNCHIDLKLTKSIIDNANNYGIQVAEINEKSSVRYNVPFELDHGAMVPLYFIDKNRSYDLIHVTYGFLSATELLKFGLAIRRAAKESNKNIVVIASGDLSHRLTKDGPYEYSPNGNEFDKTLIEVLQSGDLKGIFNINKRLIMDAGECGLRSLYILAGIISTEKIKTKLYSYEGPLGVGYAVMDFQEGSGDLYKAVVEEKRKEHERKIKEGSPYTRLARKNLDSYYSSGTLLNIDDIEEEALILDKKGVFVSLKADGELRGCIGTIEPTTSCVGEEIIRNSISAALDDPRFHPVKAEELMDIDISVDLLYPPEPADFEDLDPACYGVIVTSGSKKGLLLPNLDGVDTKEQQLQIAMSKGNISPSEAYKLERFKVERFKEWEESE